jgi:hypothetical protein
MNTKPIPVLFGLASLVIVSFAACGDDASGSPSSGSGSGNDGGGRNDGGNDGSASSGGGGAPTGSGGSGTGGAPTGSGGGGGGPIDCSEEATTADCRACCDEEHPNGAPALHRALLLDCGCKPNGACATACTADPACQDPSTEPTQTCKDCLDALPKETACVLVAESECSQQHPGCAAAVQCVDACP